MKLGLATPAAWPSAATAQTKSLEDQATRGRVKVVPATENSSTAEIGPTRLLPRGSMIRPRMDCGVVRFVDHTARAWNVNPTVAPVVATAGSWARSTAVSTLALAPIYGSTSTGNLATARKEDRKSTRLNSSHVK